MTTFDKLLTESVRVQSLGTRPVTITNRRWHRVPGKCLTDVWLMGWCIEGDGAEMELWIGARNTTIFRTGVERGESLRVGSLWTPLLMTVDRRPLKVRASRPCIVRLHIYKRKGALDEG